MEENYELCDCFNLATNSTESVLGNTKILMPNTHRVLEV